MLVRGGGAHTVAGDDTLILVADEDIGGKAVAQQLSDLAGL